jgi:hypothetical protein
MPVALILVLIIELGRLSHYPAGAGGQALSSGLRGVL